MSKTYRTLTSPGVYVVYTITNVQKKYLQNYLVDNMHRGLDIEEILDKCHIKGRYQKRK